MAGLYMTLISIIMPFNRSIPTMRYISVHFRHTAFQSTLILFVFFFFQHIQIKAQCATPINIFPYQEDFENSSGGWTSGGIANDWAWGIPAKPNINQAGSGQNCWITGGLNGSFYSLGERSYVESPCFDFTQLAHPYIHFRLWWESELQYDGANFQYSLNNGSSWTNVGSINDPTDCLNENWYNTLSVNNLSNLANPRNGWSGNIQPTTGSCQGGNGSNGWVIAKHCMANLGGKPNVRFRFTFGAGTTCNDFDGIAFDDIYIENAPPIATNFSSICLGNNTFAFTDLSGNCPDTWSWNFGDPSTAGANVSSLQNPKHTFSGPGVYMVSLKASSNCSESATITFPISVEGLNTSSTMPSCVGGDDGTASVLVNPAWVDPNYQWSTQPLQSGATATHLSAGTYWISVSGTGFCPVSTMVIVQEADPAQIPQSNLIQAISDTTIALGVVVSLTGLVADPGRVVAYRWEPAVYLDCDTCLNTLASPVQTTTYTLFATDTIGCVFSDALTIQVLKGSVYIPNVFRPASSDLNDHFTVFAARDVERVELLQVYDRWGSLVFENKNFQASDGALGWDGQIHGAEAASGVYLYVIKVLFLNGSMELFKGDLTVVR